MSRDTLIAAAEARALESFEKLLDEQKFIPHMPKLKGSRTAYVSGYLAALDEAAQASDEPVAWIVYAKGGFVRTVHHEPPDMSLYDLGETCVPAYAHPSPREARLEALLRRNDEALHEWANPSREDGPAYDKLRADNKAELEAKP